MNFINCSEKHPFLSSLGCRDSDWASHVVKIRDTRLPKKAIDSKMQGRRLKGGRPTKPVPHSMEESEIYLKCYVLNYENQILTSNSASTIFLNCLVAFDIQIYFHAYLTSAWFS